MGIVRGKSDKIDAKRITQYGEEKHKTLTISKPLNPLIMRLKELLGFRKRYVRENASYQSTLKERAHVYGINKKDIIVKSIIQNIKVN